MSLFIIIATIAVAVVCALIAFIGYAASRPASFEYARSTVISAAPEAIFPHINNLPSFDRWNPFAQNPKMQLAYSDPAEGAGASSSWTGGGSAGTLTITDTAPSSRIDMRLQMSKPIACDNYIIFSLTPGPDGTRVTWTMGGRNGLVGKIMNSLFDGEKMCAGSFEKGLADLKSRVEGERTPVLHVA